MAALFLFALYWSQIYCKNSNLAKAIFLLLSQLYCHKYNIYFNLVSDTLSCHRLSGPALGRPKKGMHPDRKLEYIDNADRVEVERAFSLSKRSFGLGLIRTKLEVTTQIGRAHV